MFKPWHRRKQQKDLGEAVLGAPAAGFPAECPSQELGESHGPAAGQPRGVQPPNSYKEVKKLQTATADKSRGAPPTPCSRHKSQFLKAEDPFSSHRHAEPFPAQVVPNTNRVSDTKQGDGHLCSLKQLLNNNISQFHRGNNNPLCSQAQHQLKDSFLR